MSIDEGYYENLIAPIEDRMIRSIWRVVRDADDADDALQEALATVWKRLDRIRRHPNPQALVLKICVDSAYDVLRKRLRSRRREDLEAVDRQLPDPHPQPLEVASGRENHAAVLRAIGELPRNQGRAVLMRIVEDEPYSAIAEALGCEEATARAHVKRGRHRLAELLAPLFPQFVREVPKS